MNKAIATLAVVALAGNIANAELLKNFKYDGKIVINAAASNNASDANSKAKDIHSDASPRVEINAGFDLNDDVNAVVSAVKCNRQYGNAGETVANGTINNFQFEQAYLNLKGVLGFDHKIGRQYYGNEGDLVVYYGPRNFPYNYAAAAPLSVTGLDAYTGWYKTGKLEIHGIAGKMANTNVNLATPDADTDLVGVSARFDLMEMLKVGGYVYEKKQYVVASDDLNTDVVGVKGMGSFLGFDYYAEFAKNYGRNAVGTGEEYTGTGMLLNVKYDLNLLGKWNFKGEMARGSGDDKTTDKKENSFQEINTDYRPGIIFGGVAGNTGIGNLYTWNLGATWAPAKIEKLTLGGKLSHFSPTVTKIDGTKIGYETYGNELDLTANWQHSENVGLLAYYGAFMVDGDYAKTVLANKDDMATTLGAALTVKF